MMQTLTTVFKLPDDLLIAQKMVYEPCSLSIKNVVQEAESQEYGACTFEIHDIPVIFRMAKITPKKVGQFVTLWKRSEHGPIMPLDVEDSFEKCIISVRLGHLLGQFVFPKEVLCAKDIISKNGKGGKRAMRIYPPWDRTENPQAKKTQAWQSDYFFYINPKSEITVQRIYALFSTESF